MKLRPLSQVKPTRRTVVVAVHREDAAGRELLTWALVKAAAAGDRVVALHVAHASAAGEGFAGGVGMTPGSAADTLTSVLGAYKGFCDRNQIDLELRVCTAASIKRALVAEATSYGAAHLVLGVTNNSSRPSRSTAVARYCAKRVPASCAVTAVSNGVAVYSSNWLNSAPTAWCTVVVETLYRKLLDVTAGDKAALQDDDLTIGDGRTLCAEVGPVRRPMKELPEVAAGWPLLRKDIIKSAALPDASSEISVVQWAMKLPTRWSVVSPPLDMADDRRQELRQEGVDPSPAPIEEEELVALRQKYSSKYTMFSYSELAKITDNFSPERVVGKGGASRVYRGRAKDGKELAVKVLEPSDEVMNEFAHEIDILSSVEHDNAMSLIGLCLDKLMLVYDYMHRGSLEQMLHGEKTDAFGSWPERFKVAVGIARALEYLHGGAHRPVIHRDVKSSNILVADDFEPKLCDFGLAVWAADAAAQVTDDDVAGTFGYLAPEYLMHGKISDKIDVYAFGVVLLELISGRKPVSAAGGPKGEESLVMWADAVVRQGKLMDLVDPSLLPQADDDGEVERMALAAALSIRREPQRRPTMSHVLKLLAGDDDAVKCAKSQVAGVSGGDCSMVLSPDKKDIIQSYINLALLDGVVDDDAGSVSSVDFVGANMSLEEYMQGRWSRSSSLNN